MYRSLPTPRPSGAPPAGPANSETAIPRRAMVARLEADGDLHDPALREALLGVRREVLFPRAYVRRNEPGAEPGKWQLPHRAHPEDLAEWLELIHSGVSVLVQHDGEPLSGQRWGIVTGGAITGMSSVMSMTVRTVGRLRLRRGLRYLDLGTGAGIASALAKHILGPDGSVTTVESDRDLADAAAVRLVSLGLDAHVLTADATGGFEADGRPYDRVLSTFAVPRLPVPWVGGARRRRSAAEHPDQQLP
ncbi:hypothetical protein [Actinacidiphila oryziradicis]|uniref:Protein-L-isoaspartate O-methyltransferase n=1 Tax=Actinacidiphila oryziradicis TaxID=2571141 RepID=A0A4U0S2N2_9ACTN|nr:hypothetical protein [Actinacidiphila oryziradicis]TKA03174.1 hypothetical protein FCI23_37125 [Actinacidiphila oryziradicis]